VRKRLKALRDTELAGSVWPVCRPAARQQITAPVQQTGHDGLLLFGGPHKEVPQIEQKDTLGSRSRQDVHCTCSLRQSVQYFSLISESTTEENTALYKVGHILNEQLVQIQLV